MKLSRTEAVHLKCLDCSGGYITERSRCRMTECPLHPYRKVGIKRTKGMSRAKAVQQYCLDCSGGSARERDICISTNCPLYPYRSPKAIKENKAENAV